jgi:hypothetical protein
MRWVAPRRGGRSGWRPFTMNEAGGRFTIVVLRQMPFFAFFLSVAH